MDRGIIYPEVEDIKKLMCFGPEDGSETIEEPVMLPASPRNSTNRKPNTLSGQAWNNLQQNKMLSKRAPSNPDLLLKEDSEGYESSISNPDYNCTTCIKSKCNWKRTSEDYIDMDNFVTEGVDDELDVNYPNPTQKNIHKNGGNSFTNSRTHCILYSFMILYFLRLIFKLNL